MWELSWGAKRLLTASAESVGNPLKHSLASKYELVPWGYGNPFIFGMPWKRPKKMFSGGKGGHCPPILARLFSTNQKRGWGFEPPQIFGPAMETYRQRDAKRRRKPQNAANAAKRHKTPQNAAKRRKTPPKHRKTPQMIAKSPSTGPT